MKRGPLNHPVGSALPSGRSVDGRGVCVEEHSLKAQSLSSLIRESMIVQTQAARDIHGEDHEGGARRSGSAGPQRSFAFYTETFGMELVNDSNRLEIFSQEMTPADGKQFLYDA
jgi:hypothetical protein